MIHHGTWLVYMRKSKVLSTYPMLDQLKARRELEIHERRTGNQAMVAAFENSSWPTGTDKLPVRCAICKPEHYAKIKAIDDLITNR